MAGVKVILYFNNYQSCYMWSYQIISYKKIIGDCKRQNELNILSESCVLLSSYL